MSDKEYPSLFQQAKNLSKFSWEMMQYIMQNEQKVMFVSDEVFRSRLEVCKGCDKFDDLQMRCTECGCFLNQKARMVLDGCPLNKWSANQEQWEKNMEEFINQDQP
jgi:hypothetical protein